MRRSTPAWLMVSVVLVLATRPAFAHVPATEPGASGAAVAIGGPEVSRATYGYLAADEEYDEYVFTVTERVTRPVGVIVPAYPEHADFRPSLEIRAEDGDPVRIPVDKAEVRRAEFEPFSLASFWHGAEEDISFEPGTYTVRVLRGDGDSTGRYVVVFGGPEQFEAGDIGSTLGQLPVIWFGAYGGAPFRWNWLVLIPMSLAVAALAGLALLVRPLLRRLRR